MSVFKRFWEWYLGLPPVDPGEGTAWDIEYHRIAPEWLPSWIALLLVGMLVAAAVWVSLRDSKNVSRKMRALLLGLRLAAIALLLVALSGMTLSVDRTGLPVIVVLIDDSASMSVEDAYTDEATRRAVRALLDETDTRQASRLDLVRAILARDDARLLRRLRSRHELRVYRFSDTAATLGLGASDAGGELEPLIERIEKLAAEGDRTRPGPALRKVLDDLRGTPPSAVVIFSDGITSTTEADRLTTAIDAARRNVVPVFTVGIGSAEPARDLQIDDVLVQEIVFAKEPVVVSGRLKSFGHAGESVMLQLKDDESGAVLAEKRVTAPSDGESVKVELVHTPPREGEYDYVFEVVPEPDEANKANNSETRHVSVRDVTIRVLLADSIPRNEFLFVKHLLERNPTVELHTVLQDSDPDYATDDQTSLAHFPIDREKLFEYDVVIFGDVNPGHLGPGVLANLRDFVSESGGGILFVAGMHYNPAAYRETALETILPVELDSVRLPPPDAAALEGFRSELTAEGRNWSTIFRFADDEAESLRIWRDLPPLYWSMQAAELKPGAVAFVERATATGTSHRVPLIAMQRVGTGKVLFHTTDDLWRWRFLAGDSYYGRYWIQAIRYLGRSKVLNIDRTTELETDRRVYRQGDTVRLTLEFLDERLTPSEDDDVTVMVERRGGRQKSVTMTRLARNPNVFEGSLGDAAKGSYHAWIVSPAFDGSPPARDFRVEEPLHEMRRRNLDRSELMQTAEATHGRYLTPADVEELPDLVPDGDPVPLENEEPVPLWNRWELLLLFAGVLSTEWMLRKRARLV